MGGNSFFGQQTRNLDDLTGKMNFLHLPRFGPTGNVDTAPVGPMHSGWNGPSLAGANAGYGGVQPGTTPTAGMTGPGYYAANPYVYAAQQATKGQ